MGGSKKHQAHNLLVVSEQKFEVELKKYVNDIQFFGFGSHVYLFMIQISIIFFKWKR